jgi:hypothetical protein
MIQTPPMLNTKIFGVRQSMLTVSHLLIPLLLLPIVIIDTWFFLNRQLIYGLFVQALHLPTNTI